MTMTSRERVLSALKREGIPDKTPFEISWGSFTPRLMKTYHEKTGSELSSEEYFDYDTRFVLPGPGRVKTDFTQFFVGDDMVSQQGLMMSKETYRTFFKSRIKSIVDAAKKVNPLQPECNDLEMIHSKYKDRLSFWGGIGVQSVLHQGTPEDVKAKVIETTEMLGKEGGLLLAPAHILDPAIPWENIEAYINAAKSDRCVTK